MWSLQIDQNYIGWAKLHRLTPDFETLRMWKNRTSLDQIEPFEWEYTSNGTIFIKNWYNSTVVFCINETSRGNKERWKQQALVWHASNDCIKHTNTSIVHSNTNAVDVGLNDSKIGSLLKNNRYSPNMISWMIVMQCTVNWQSFRVIAWLILVFNEKKGENPSNVTRQTRRSLLIFWLLLDRYNNNVIQLCIVFMNKRVEYVNNTNI